MALGLQVVGLHPSRTPTHPLHSPYTRLHIDAGTPMPHLMIGRNKALPALATNIELLQQVHLTLGMAVQVRLGYSSVSTLLAVEISNACRNSGVGGVGLK